MFRNAFLGAKRPLTMRATRRLFSSAARSCGPSQRILYAAMGGACGLVWMCASSQAHAETGDAQQLGIAAKFAGEAREKWRQKHRDGEAIESESGELQLYALEEVQKHRSAGSLWVTYKGEVYDVTEFLKLHPGGHDLLLSAGGLDLGHFFSAYTVHLRSDKALEWLQSYKIGRLSPEDARRAEEYTTTKLRLERRDGVSRSSTRRLGLVILTAPIWFLLRLCVRILAFCIPPAARAIAGLLPVSVPGVGDAAQIKGGKVAVIGGGIAGSGAAFALKESGFEVELFEAREQLGGNAKTFIWEHEGKEAKSGLAVLGWPIEYFKNYGSLLNKLGVAVASVELPFWIRSTVPGAEGDFAQLASDKLDGPDLRDRFEPDFKRWDSLVRLVRRVNNFFNWVKEGDELSAYRMSFLNPFNMVSIKTLWGWCGGSREFWDVILVSLYDSTFLTTQLDAVPAVVAPMMDDIIPLNRCSVLNSWAEGDSQQVFKGMTKGVKVTTDTRVLAVEPLPAGGIQVTDERGRSETFDKVVFACQASAVGSMLRPSNWVESALFRAFKYTDDNEPGWLNPTVHSDGSIIPEEHRERVLKDYANYIEVGAPASKEGDYHYENSFVLNWVPTSKVFDKPPAMLVTHDLSDHKTLDPKEVRGTTCHARAHPDLNFTNLLATQLLPLVQGRRGVYYCCNYTTPANGHDLSLLSGFVAANAVGAAYPFPENESAEADFHRLRNLMGL
eukprot:Hpha_TRINITY_DN14378_c0_g1::TRINITY_DN14378_c0_g1_i1::g.86587::m.86587